MSKTPRKGDIILFKLCEKHWWRKPISWFISWVTGSPVSHAAILAHWELKVMVEAKYPKVKRSFIDGEDRRYYEYMIVRVKDLSYDMSLSVVHHALRLEKRRYDVKALWGLLKLYFMKLFLMFDPRKYLIVEEKEGQYFCQELVTTVYQRAGYDLAAVLGFNDPSAIVPADIYKEVFSKSPEDSIFEVIRPFTPVDSGCKG